MRPPWRAQPTRRLPRVRSEHGLVAHPVPTHKHSPSVSGFCILFPRPSHLSLALHPSHPAPCRKPLHASHWSASANRAKGVARHSTRLMRKRRSQTGVSDAAHRLSFSQAVTRRPTARGQDGNAEPPHRAKGRGAHLVTRPAMRLAALRSFCQSWVPMGFIGS